MPTKPAVPAAPAAPVSLAKQAQAIKAGKRKPVFRDVPGVARVPLADGRVGCVQHEIFVDGDPGAWMLTIPRKNADGTEAGQRYSLADIQLLVDAYNAAGIQLV